MSLFNKNISNVNSLKTMHRLSYRIDFTSPFMVGGLHTLLDTDTPTTTQCEWIF